MPLTTLAIWCLSFTRAGRHSYLTCFRYPLKIRTATETMRGSALVVLTLLRVLVRFIRQRAAASIASRQIA